MSSAFEIARDLLEARIPAELRSRAQWIAWVSVIGEGCRVQLPNAGWTKVLRAQPKPHKLPINPATGALASTTRPRTWSSAGDANAAVHRWSLTGVGFVFTDSDPYTGVDIDNCRDADTGRIEEWAHDIVRILDSYTEISPSGTGIHIIVRGKLPDGRGNQATHHGGKVEMFSRARYFTFSGIHVDGSPIEIFDRQTELLRLHKQLFVAKSTPEIDFSSGERSPLPIGDHEVLANSRSAEKEAKFVRLWNGQWQADYTSQSEADLALCFILAFRTHNDAARIDSLFRQSGLMREKWNREDYRKRTIQKALTKTADTYKPGRRASSKIGATSRMTREVQPVSANQPAPDLLYFPHTDTGNAERLLRLYGSDIRFCLETKQWLVWDGRRWNSADSRRVRQLFKKTIREFHKQAADIADKDTRQVAEKHARQSEAAMKIRAALECAESEEGIGVSAGALDQRPYLLNCKNGTVDLRTGQLRMHDRRDLITKVVHFAYRPDARCPQFLRFLYRIMGDNPDGELSERTHRRVVYLQKCFGYALTGDVSEKVAFCFFGGGNNGKTTLLEMVRFILAEYSAQVLIDSLMAHHSRESSTSVADLADLRGARFVTTSESEEGQRLAIGKLKYLTQGMGEIKACRKYENPIVFKATHKLFLDANHKPVIRGAEKAVWNRLKPVPFLVTIPPGEADKSLLEKLKAEAEGILGWMVEGNLRWRREGLGDPPEVAEAAATWQAESDRFPAFLEEHYELQRDAWIPVAEPWPTYMAWCDLNRERDRLSKATFDTRLQDLGCQKGVRDGGRVRAWIGIRPRSSEDLTRASDKVTAGDGES